MGKKEKALKRVVIDTNVLVSALLFRGRTTGLVDLWKEGKIVPVISRDTFAEFAEVLNYPKFALTDDEVRAIVEDELLPFCEVVDVKEKISGVCRDPFDDQFLAVAVNSGAAWIVSGDRDLLDLGSYGKARIVSPQEFLSQFMDGQVS